MDMEIISMKDRCIFKMNSLFALIVPRLCFVSIGTVRHYFLSDKNQCRSFYH